MTALAALLALLIQAPVPPQTGLITGQIHLADRSGQQPHIRVAAVPAGESAANEPATLLAITETDDFGRFRLENVPPGRYYVMAGYVAAPDYYPGVQNLAEAQAINVDAGIAVTGIDFTIQFSETEVVRLGQRVTKINGSITGSGEIPSGLSVGIEQRTQMRTTAVQADGSFSLQLPRGEYTVSVVNIPSRFLLSSMSYGGVDLLRAPLKVDGSLPADIQIRLQPVDPGPVFNVKGHITNAPGAYFGRRSMIRLRPNLPSSASRSMSLASVYPDGQVELPVSSDGTFEIPDVVPGPYLLIPLGSPVSGVRGVPVVVSDHDLLDVEVPLPPMAELATHVTIVDEMGNVIPNALLPSTVRLRYGSDHGGGLAGLRTLVPPGRLTISFEDIPNEYTVVSAVSGTVDLLKTSLNVDAALEPIEIQLTLQLRKGR